MLISVAFQQFYNIVDSVVAGKFISANALAAVGASYPVTMIFMAVALGSNIGCSVVISQLFGGKELTKMKTAIWTSIISIIVLSLVLTVLGLLFCNPLMHLLNTPENIFYDSTLYLKIYIGGLLFVFLYNICTGVFTALGDSMTPLFFLILSSLGNVGLDLLFVIQFHMGVAGVAWATFLMQGVASVLAIITLLNRLNKIETKKYEKFSAEMLRRISRIAIPSILQQSFISVGNLLIQGLINSYGSTVIAGYSAAIKLNTFAITSFATLGSSLSSFVAQNIGAGKPKRVMKGFWAAFRMSMCVAVPCVILYFMFGNLLMDLFVKEESKDVITIGSNFLKIVSPFYLIICIKLIADGVLRGSGAMKYFMISTFADLILRVALAFILSIPFGITGIWLSWPIGWTLATILNCYYIFSGKWKKYSF
jgi:putative MATE family efflux protein